MIHLQFWELRELFTRLLVERDSTLMFNCLICIFRVETNRKINYSCSPSSLRVQRAAWRWLMKLKQKKEVYSIKVANRMRRARGAVCCLRRWTANLEKLNKTTTKKNQLHNQPQQNGMYPWDRMRSACSKLAARRESWWDQEIHSVLLRSRSWILNVDFSSSAKLPKGI